MPRLPRIHIEGGLYYAIARGDHGGDLFKDNTDREKYLELLANYKQQYDFKLFSYVLMPNYIYLLIEPASGTTISQIMHDINSTYTKYFNGRYRKHGHLFQERFRAILVEKDSYLKKLTRYIHLTPLKTHLADRAGGYPWSSYQAYINKLQATSYRLQVKVDTEEVLEAFCSELEKSRGLYQEFVESGPENEMEVLEKKLRRGILLGSNGFVKKVKAEASSQKLEGATQKLEGATHKPWVKAIAFASAVVLFFIVNGYLILSNQELKKSVKTAVVAKEAEKTVEFKKDLKAAKENLKRDLTEKYRADMVSYQAMMKRLIQMEEDSSRLKKESNQEL